MTTIETLATTSSRPPIAQTLNLKPRIGFANTSFVQELTDRALAYIQAGLSVHFCGPSGSGKTTVAMHLASQLGNPVMLVTGDDQFGSSNLVGGQTGYRRRKVVDNYVRSVLKTEEDMTQRWADSRLTVACQQGYTLVYDEFTRSRPEANNVLLSVLEEKLLVLPTTRDGNSYLKVHPDFAAIFTSNPEEYAGVHKTQDALRDRMITIYMDFFDRETEVLIMVNRTGLDPKQAGKIVDLVRAYREQPEIESKPTVRAALTIGRVASQRGLLLSILDERFMQVCFDVLVSSALRGGNSNSAQIAKYRKVITLLVEQFCGR